MPTVSTVLRTDRINKKGKAPVNFFIVKDRKLTKISTGILVEPKFWDEKKCRIKNTAENSARLNSYLTNKFSELQDQVFEHETVNKSLSTRQLKDKIYGVKPTDFFHFADEALQQYLLADQISTYDRGRYIIAKLKAFCGPGELTFQDITLDFLSKYEKYLRSKLHNSTNTIHKNLKFIRKLFNDAYRVDLIEHHQNPFNKYQLKTQKTQREFLSEEELNLIENFRATPGTKMEMHQHMFVFASYAGGLRVSDVLQLQWKNFDGTHIHVAVKKTAQQLSFKLPEHALEIINRYKPVKASPESFIFPMLPESLNLNDARNVNKSISSATAYINKNLKLIAQKVGIEKPLSFHISRHTWATRALRKGISIDKVSKIMGHAAIRETQIYAKIVNEELDKAMDVFNA
ncbi:MAG: site-specific integrase [Chitinophagaceae bacterium]|nr:site-specific integrase [Chitinophagaceae bacterium]